MAKKSKGTEWMSASIFYSNIDPRRRPEHRDAQMIHPDHQGIANLSSRFIHKEWPKDTIYVNPWPDGGISEGE